MTNLKNNNKDLKIIHAPILYETYYILIDKYSLEEICNKIKTFLEEEADLL